MLILALVAGFATAQIDHTYQSANAVYASNQNYVLCVTCPEATPKTPVPLPLKVEKAEPAVDAAKVEKAPIHLNFAGLLRKKAAPVVLPEIKETVFFDIGSAKLKNTEIMKLDAMDKDREYSVTGYTCDLGSADVNDALALERAKTVAKYLGDIVFEIAGKGKCCFTEPQNRDADRRVEIISGETTIERNQGEPIGVTPMDDDEEEKEAL